MSNTTSLKRIFNETKQLLVQNKEYEKMFSVKMIDNNIFQYRATIYGPPKTPYDGYEFDVDLVLPENYPNSSIAVKFITPIQHVNINNAGDICLDILKDGWKVSMNISLVLLAIVDLLCKPNLEDPLNSDLADLYRKNKDKYISTIEFNCDKYAKKRII
jgi:ubiquitin-protein ligase